MAKLLSTITKRKHIAEEVGGYMTSIWERPVKFERSKLHPNEFDFRMENYESDNGEIRWCHVSICPRGVNVHIKFGSKLFSPGQGPKWNHYLWPGEDWTLEDYLWSLASEMNGIMAKVKPNGRVRQNLPDIGPWWMHERATFAQRGVANHG